MTRNREARRPATPVGRGRRHRILRLLAIVGIALVALVLLSAGTNALLTRLERESTPAYGERVAVDGGSLNVYRHGESGPIIVLLSGYETAAPTLDFAPLIRELDGFRVIVVEGFGYGYSDTDVPPRTIENVTAELHQVLGRLGVDEPVVLAAHSLGGLYTLFYANRYPDEVSAVVGIDASVPGQINGLAGGRSTWERLIPASGLLRAALTLFPALAEPTGDTHTAQEREQIRLMANWNYANPAILDEGNQATRSFTAVEDLMYPAEIPVLAFIKKEGNQAGWRELHERQLEGREHGELIELDGGHYLHWTQSPRIASTIRSFLDESLPR
jgi:pimeloyl-ACP methyl ester carboxylesterase